MLHHSNSRNQRNKGSRIKTLLQATLLLGVVFWLLYQVKHSYAKKNEYLDDTEDQLDHNDRSIFQGRKEKAGSYNSNNVAMVGENFDVITKPEEGESDQHSDSSDHNDEKSGETVFDRDSTDLHEDDRRNSGVSEAEERQVKSSDGSTEAHNNNNEDEKPGHSEEDKHDTESKSDAESKSEIHSSGGDVTQINQAQEENTRETDGSSHDEVAQGDESTNADQTNASSSGSDGEGGEKKEEMDIQTGSESLPGDAKAETNNGHDTGSLPDETGNVPSVHTDKSQHDSSENQSNAASTTADSSENSITEAVNIETGLEDVAATTSSETASGDGKDNSVESDSSGRATAEEKTGTASGDDEKGAETGTSNQAKSDEGSAATEANAQGANAEAGNSQGESSGDAVTGSSEEANQSDGATETSNNGEQADTRIETITSTNDEHKESQGGDGSGPEQTGNTQSQ